jgi:hypothetical protein
MSAEKTIKPQAKTSLPPLYTRLTKAYAEYTGMSESAVIASAVKDRFDNMPIQERDRLLSITKK